MKPLAIISLAFSLLLAALALAKTYEIEIPSGAHFPVRVEARHMIERVKINKTYYGKASWYGESEEECKDCRADRIMYCDGERFRDSEYTIATPLGKDKKPIIPCGTHVRILANGRSVEAVITDTGGFKKLGRIADLSKATFAALAPLSKGVITVEITELNP